MQEPFDRAAMIEAASRKLRQQMARGNARERPLSKGSLRSSGGGSTVGGDYPREGLQRGMPSSGDGHTGSSGCLVTPGMSQNSNAGSANRSSENAQRRIRSAENQHRFVHSDVAAAAHAQAQAAAAAPDADPAIPAVPQAASALDNYNSTDEDLPEDMQVQVASPAGFQELKRPLSRKKDPSASAAAGLGVLDGPARMTDAFEQRKTRQPIPVESWGPRPPSRAGLPQKAAPRDEGLDVDPKILLSQARGRSDSGANSSAGRLASKGSSDQAPFASKVVGGTWAAARVEPRVHSETRRGRERRPSNRTSQEVNYTAADLGIFGCGVGVPSQRLPKSFSGVFDHPSAQLGLRGSPWQPHAGNPLGLWASHVTASSAVALEVSGSSPVGDGVGGPWPGSPGSPPTRGKMRHDGVSVEDIEADADLPHGGYRRDATPPQVIVTRSCQPGKSRGSVRRGSGDEHHSSTRDREQNMPFDTSLDVDFLSLFAA